MHAIKNCCKQIKIKHNILRYIVLLLFIFSISSFKNVWSASALSYSSSTDADVGFVVKDTINISFDGTLSITDLLAGSSAVSQPMTVRVSTNKAGSYTLSAKMENESADLTNNDTSLKFTGLASNASVETLTEGTWGLKTSVDNGSTWSSYSGLPISTATEKELVTKEITEPGTENILKVLIGASALNGMPGGNYTNTITFFLVAGVPAPLITNMQDFSCSSLASGETVTLRDSRDNTDYAVSKLADGNCWMLDNLALGGTSAITLSSTDTNMSASSWTLPASAWYNDYTEAKILADYKDTVPAGAPSGSLGSNKVGVYYNLCAASTGTVCQMGWGEGESNAEYDICPKGWRLPTGGSSGEYQALYTAYNNNATNFKGALSTPFSGALLGSDSPDAYLGSLGYFWTSIAFDSSDMYTLSVSASINTTDRIYRYIGGSVRCISQ